MWFVSYSVSAHDNPSHDITSGDHVSSRLEMTLHHIMTAELVTSLQVLEAHDVMSPQTGPGIAYQAGASRIKLCSRAAEGKLGPVADELMEMLKPFSVATLNDSLMKKLELVRMNRCLNKMTAAPPEISRT